MSSVSTSGFAPMFSSFSIQPKKEDVQESRKRPRDDSSSSSLKLPLTPERGKLDRVKSDSPQKSSSSSEMAKSHRPLIKVKVRELFPVAASGQEGIDSVFESLEKKKRHPHNRWVRHMCDSEKYKAVVMKRSNPPVLEESSQEVRDEQAMPSTRPILHRTYACYEEGIRAYFAQSLGKK